jgi:hypothetical protein
MKDIATIEMGTTPKGRIVYIAKLMRAGETRGKDLERIYYSTGEAENAIREQSPEAEIISAYDFRKREK